MSFLTALRQHTIKRLEEIGQVDLLIGIPSYNNDLTVAQVMKTVSQGAAEYFPGAKVLVFVSDGGSTDDTRDAAHDVELDPFMEKLVQIYRGIPGKGSALRGVFEAAHYLKAKATLVVDADLRSIEPDWVRKLASPVFSGEYDFVAPLYSRYKYDGTITNNIAYDLTRTLYGKRVRQPIGGDFCFSRELAETYLKEDVWDTDVATFGIDVWMTTMAITSGHRLCQTRLGVKVHGRKDPAIHLGTMFREVVITMFALMEKFELFWRGIKKSSPVDTIGEAPAQEPEASPVDLEALVENFRIGYDHFSPIWKTVLSRDDMKMVSELRKVDPVDFHLDIELWARIVYDFASTFRNWPKDKVKLVNTMTPLYYAQVASFIRETADMSNAEAEGVIEEYASQFEKLKPYLIQQWEANGKA